MHPVVRCKEHEGGRRPLFDICETNEYGEVRVPLLLILSFLVFPSIPNALPLRRHSKYTVIPTSRLRSHNLTRSSAKRGGWTTSSKRRTSPQSRRSMATGMGLVQLQRCLLQASTVVQTHSVRTARRPSLHSSIRYHVQERSHVIGVTLKVGHRCRSPTDTATHTDSAHSFV